MSFQTFYSCFIDIAGQKYLDVVDPFPHFFFTWRFSILNELQHSISNSLQDQMLIEVFLIGDVQLINNNDELWPLVQQSIEDILLKAASYVEDIYNI